MRFHCWSVKTVVRSSLLMATSIPYQPEPIQRHALAEEVLDSTFRIGRHAATAPLESNDEEPPEESLMPRRFIHLRDVIATGGGFSIGGTKLQRIRLPIARVSAWFIGRLEPA